MSEPQITTKDVVMNLDRKVDELKESIAEIKVLAVTVNATTVTLADHEKRLRVVEDEISKETGKRSWLSSFWARLLAAGTVFGGAWWLPDVFRHN